MSRSFEPRRIRCPALAALARASRRRRCHRRRRRRRQRAGCSGRHRGPVRTHRRRRRRRQRARLRRRNLRSVGARLHRHRRRRCRTSRHQRRRAEKQSKAFHFPLLSWKFRSDNEAAAAAFLAALVERGSRGPWGRCPSADLDVRHLGFELGHQVADSFARRLPLDEPPVVEQSPPMVERVLVDRAPPPPAGARDSGDQVGADRSFNLHRRLSR